MPSDLTFETAIDTLKSVSPIYDVSKSEVDGAECKSAEGFSAKAANTKTAISDDAAAYVASSNSLTKNSEAINKDDLPSQPEHLPSLTPLDFTKINNPSTKSNQDCIVTTLCTNPLTQSKIVATTSGFQKSITFSLSPHLETPGSTGTPKTPSPRLRSLLNMAGYSSQDIQDAMSPVPNTPQVKCHPDKSTAVKTTSPSFTPVSTPVLSPSVSVTSFQPVNTSSSVLNPFALHQMQVGYLFF